MNIKKINAVMEQYLQNGDMLGAVLYVHQDGEPIYQGEWGHFDLQKTKPVDSNTTIFRMASLSKVVTAVGILKLIESGKVGLDDKLCTYLPEFSSMRVVDDPRFTGMESLVKYFVQKKPAPLDNVKTVPADRDLTIRDLLTHSSGMEMGTYGLLTRLALAKPDDTLALRVAHFAQTPLDFQPGTGTGYSATGSFDTLARLTEIVSGTEYSAFMKKELFDPLSMKDAAYHLSQEQESRLAVLYRPNNGSPVDATGTSEDLPTLASVGPRLPSGAGGLMCTAQDFDHFTRMLASGGKWDGQQILKPETVKMMYTETAYRHLEPEPGMEWGLGVKIRRNPKMANSFATAGSYGWSGAFGTHMVISPTDGISICFCMNRSDMGGSGSYISRKVEELVFGADAQ